MKSGDQKRPVTEPSTNEWNGPRRKRAGRDLVYTLRYPVRIPPPSSPFSYRSAAFPTPGFHSHGTPVDRGAARGDRLGLGSPHTTQQSLDREGLIESPLTISFLHLIAGPSLSLFLSFVELQVKNMSGRGLAEPLM